MGRPHTDISNQTFGRLTARRWIAGTGREGGWECTCECGRMIFIRRTISVRRHLSCGCLQQSQTMDEALQKFWAKVAKGPQCWLWTAGTLKSGGYGGFVSHFFPSESRAHRVSWIIENGPIPDGLHVLHRCDNPPCVRPDHLFLGTNLDNIIDRMRKDRSWSKLTRALAEQIRADTRPNIAIAAEHGVDRSLIRLIKKREIWVIPNDHNPKGQAS